MAHDNVAPFMTKRLALALLLLAVGSMEWKGYRFGGSNQSLQIPLLKHLADPTLYVRDPILTSFEGYASYFYHALAPLVRLVEPLERLFFILYLAVHFAALAAVHALGRRLFASSAAATLACVLYLGQAPSLGAELAYWPRLTHAHAATAVLLWALYFHLSGRTRLALVACGLAFNIHALYAAYVFVLLAADLAFRWRERGVRRLVVDLALFAACAAPTAGWILFRQGGEPVDWWPLWLQIMRERSGPHTFPLTVPAAVFARYALLLALGIAAFVTAPATERPAAVVRFAGAVVVLCVIGFVFAEYMPVRRVIEAQLFRSTKWLTFFILLYVARLVQVSWQRGGLARGAAVAVFAGLLLQQPAWIAVGLALYILEPRGWPFEARAAAGLALLAAAVTQAAPLPERLGLHQVVLAASAVLEKPAVVACLVGFVLLQAGLQRGDRVGRATAAVGVVAALAFALPRMYRDHLVVVRGEPWHDVQLWVRGHTPKDAVVLTPPHREGFRVFSERAIVGEWKDGTQQFFSAPFARDWHERMQELGGGATPVYDGFGAERLAELAARFGADYVVVRADAVLPSEPLYANDEFAVHRTPSSRAARAQP